MSRNLKDRLRRIRNTGSPSCEGTPAPKAGPSKAELSRFDRSAWPRWSPAGFKTITRELVQELPVPPSAAFPKALAILVPDLARMQRIPSQGELLFFDLETTGLSGGAGTVAFLAAFGRFDGNRLTITQYLLLDYPGEPDFIERAVKEFAPQAEGAVPLVVSYNGKSFDSQILNNRCLMNGISPPNYFHADLLHPSRRLWKRVLPDCSQSTVEVSVLGLDRTGDVSGALAPDIWFSFLKTGENRELLAVCDHNIRDIFGLASLFLALGEIAADPIEGGKKFRVDDEALALSWRGTVKRYPSFFCAGEREKGDSLLKTAADAGYPRAAFALALDLFKGGRSVEGRELMRKIAEDLSPSAGLRAAALKSLAMDAEWRLKNPPLALAYTDSALAVPEIPMSLRNELERRRVRLEGKDGNSG